MLFYCRSFPFYCFYSVHVIFYLFHQFVCFLSSFRLTNTVSFWLSGSQTAPSFGQAQFGNQAGGTRIKPYAQTPDADSTTSGTQPAGKLDSISAMPEYKDKSHEELRWEDYQRGDKGEANHFWIQYLVWFTNPLLNHMFNSMYSFIMLIFVWTGVTN